MKARFAPALVIVQEIPIMLIVLVQPVSALAMLAAVVREAIARLAITADNQTIAASLSRFAK